MTTQSEVATEAATTSSTAVRKEMWKHKFLKHPIVLLSRAAIFLASLYVGSKMWPTLPNPELLAYLGFALIFMGTGYLAHKKRGAVMEFSVRDSKYHTLWSGHDRLYKLALKGKHEFSRGAARRVRFAYGFTEASSMFTFGLGITAFIAAISL